MADSWHAIVVGLAGFIAVAGVILIAVLHGSPEHDDEDVDR